MGKGEDKKKKKKKGRPSLLDIQKRNLKLQQEQQNLITNPNLKTSNSPNPHRRFTRRNPNPDGVLEAEKGSDEEEEDDDDEGEGNRRERKLNHVLRAPPNHRSSVNSPYLDLALYGSDSNEDEDDNGGTQTPLKKKQKINAGSAKKGEKHNSAWKATEKQHLAHGTPLLSGPTTPLPDKKLLVFILDRLQKKDTYGVYSEPVDPDELPDYHEIIENPMDFGTVRKKLEDGAYNNLEQFEHDVFLISSNAMQYNAPDSVYFRQARTIHELAKKDFENLRRDSDTEQEPKIVRRGRPPKNLKKLLGKSSSERDGLDATPIKGEDNAAWSNSYNLRKGRLPDKYVSVETSKRAFHGSRNSEAYSWLPEYKFDKSDEFSGSSLKGFSMKYGKKQFVLDESRRNTYNNSHPSVVGSESSVLNTFDGEVKQLLPVGLHTELGYARSLARFAANLGPVAWKVASRKIERALPPGLKFGPGWVGDDEAPPILTSSLTTASPCPLPQQQTIASTQIPSSTAGPCMLESIGDRLLKQEFTNNSSLDGYPDKIIPSIITPFSTGVSRSLEAIGEPIEASNRISDGGFGLLSNGSGGVRPPIQIHQSTLITPAANGCSSGFGANPSSQMGKLIGPSWSAGSLGTEASVHSRIFDMVSKSNFINSTHGNPPELQNPKQPSSSSVVMRSQDGQAGAGVEIHAQPGWNGLLLQQKPDLIHPDLNVRFQSPGSSNSSVRVGSPSPQPDLALQL